jgi:hypothetical protein
MNANVRRLVVRWGLAALALAGLSLVLCFPYMAVILMVEGARMAITGDAGSADVSGWGARVIGLFALCLGAGLGGLFLSWIPPLPWPLVEQFVAGVAAGPVAEKAMTAIYRLAGPLVAAGALVRRIGGALAPGAKAVSGALARFGAIAILLVVFIDGVGVTLLGVTEDGKPDWLFRGGGAAVAVISLLVMAALVRSFVRRRRNSARLAS